MGLFDNSEILTNRTFSWALGPYFAPPTDLEDFPEDVSKISLFVDENGTVNVDEQLYLYKQTDPIDALYGSEVKWSEDNGFVKSLAPLLGVPTFSIITYPWYRVTVESGEVALKEISFPNDTPEGFWPCSGYKVKIGGVEYRLPQLIYRKETPLGETDPKTTYLAPPGCAFMMKLPSGGYEGATESNFFFQEVDVQGGFEGKLKTWGNPQDPFDNYLGLLV